MSLLFVCKLDFGSLGGFDKFEEGDLYERLHIL
jgi:hypothetical protein